jgi:ankyrin repeat protein
MSLSGVTILHRKVIKNLKLYGLKGNENGICGGISFVYLVYAALGKEEEYKELMNRIAAYDYMENTKKLKEKLARFEAMMQAKKELIRTPVDLLRHKILTIEKKRIDVKKDAKFPNEKLNQLMIELNRLDCELILQKREREVKEADLETTEEYLTVEDQAILNTFPFIEWIEIGQQPQDYEDFIGESLSQVNLQEAMDNILSQGQKKLDVICHDSQILNEKELTHYLEDLAVTLNSLEEKNLPIAIGGATHRIGLRFNKDKNKWIFADPNTPLREIDRSEITKEFVKALFDDKPNKDGDIYTGFSLSIICDKNSASYAAAKTALDHFKERHKITKEMLNRKTSWGCHLYALALRETDLDLIKQIAVYHPKMDKSEFANELMHRAVRDGAMPLFHWLLDQGVALQGRTIENETVAGTAVHYGKISILKEIIHNIKVNDPHGEQGRTLVHIAAKNGRVPILRYLADLKPPADFKQLDKKGKNVLIIAAEYGHLDVVHYLQKEHKASFTKKDIHHLGLIAAKKGNVLLLQYLITQGLNLSEKNSANETLAHIAARAGQVAIIHFLLEKKPSLFKAQDNSGYTPIESAAKSGHASIVQIIGKSKGISFVNGSGETLATLAMQDGHVSVLEMLGAMNPDLLKIFNADGLTPFQIAKKQAKIPCSLIYMKSILTAEKYGIPGEVKSAYIITDTHLYYTDQSKDLLTEIPLTAEKLEQLHYTFHITNKIKPEEKKPIKTLYSEMQAVDLEKIALVSGRAFGIPMLNVLKNLLNKQENEKKEDPIIALAKSGDLASIKKLMQQSSADELAYWSAEQGHADIIRVLAEEKLIAVNDLISDDDKNTLACVAAEYGHLSVIKILKQLNADFNQARFKSKKREFDAPLFLSNTETPLQIAVQKGHLNVIKELIQDLDLSRRDPESKQSLAFQLAPLAIQYPQILQFLVEKDKSIIYQFDNEGHTLLYHAIRSNKLDVIKMLADHGSHLDQEVKGSPPIDAITILIHPEASLNQEIKGSALAYFAAKHDSSDCLLLLAHLGADLFKHNEAKISPIFIAIKKGWTNVVTFTLVNAIKKGNLDQLQQLLELKVDFNQPNEYGRLPVEIALHGHQMAVLQFFAEQKTIAFNHTDRLGRTLAFVAAQSGQADALTMLIKLASDKRLDLNQGDKYGRTPVFIAAEQGNIEILRLLAKAGVDLNKPDETGLTPAMIAAQKGHLDVIHELSQLSEKKDRPTVNFNVSGGPLGATLIGTALLFERLDIFEMLLKNKNVDIMLPDKNGKMITMIAVQQNNMKAVQLLLSYGADFSQASPSHPSPMAVLKQDENWPLLLNVLLESKNIPKDLDLNPSVLQKQLISMLENKEGPDQDRLLYQLFANDCALLKIVMTPKQPIAANDQFFKAVSSESAFLAEIKTRFKESILRLYSSPVPKKK